MHLVSEHATAHVYSSLPPRCRTHAANPASAKFRSEAWCARDTSKIECLTLSKTRVDSWSVSMSKPAYDLARVLGVSLESVPIDRERMIAQLNAGDCDILMSAIAVTPVRAAELSLSSSFRDDTLAFVVPDYRRKEFLARAAIRVKKGLRLGILREEYYAAKARDALPQAEWVELSSPREFFSQPRSGQLDALLLTAEAGSAWTLMQPEFAVVVAATRTPFTSPGLRSRSG